jgi:hypothetical protein
MTFVIIGFFLLAGGCVVHHDHLMRRLATRDQLLPDRLGFLFSITAGLALTFVYIATGAL